MRLIFLITTNLKEVLLLRHHSPHIKFLEIARQIFIQAFNRCLLPDISDLHLYLLYLMLSRVYYFSLFYFGNSETLLIFNTQGYTFVISSLTRCSSALLSVFQVEFWSCNNIFLNNFL